MSHQSQKSQEEIVVNYEAIKQAVDLLVTAEALQGLRARKGSLWKPRLLAVTAIFWVWSQADVLTERFAEARKVAAKIFRWLPAPGTSYQGFVKQLQKWHVHLKIALMGELRVRMQEDLAGQWQIAGYVIIAGDGSRIELPRTLSNEAGYSPKPKKPSSQQKKKKKKKGASGRKRQSAEAIRKKANSPQMWLTLFWHVGTGLPWAWRTGPSDSSERQHLEEMLGELPENTLITADAGFVGYDFWRAVMEAGHHFVIRAGANVRLLKKLGFRREGDDTVYLWPDWAAKRGLPPLVLRVVWIRDGKQPMCLLTDILDKEQLSDEQIVEIYKARWGIELFFRTFKQTFGRKKLRSHTAEHAELEADWSLLGLWAICLLAQRELVRSGQDPSRLSPAAAIRAIQRAMRDYRTRPDSPQESLSEMFRHALRDKYRRTSAKTAREYPAKRKRKPTGVPNIDFASKSQVAAAQELKRTQPDFRLPA